MRARSSTEPHGKNPPLRAQAFRSSRTCGPKRGSTPTRTIVRLRVCTASTAALLPSPCVYLAPERVTESGRAAYAHVKISRKTPARSTMEGIRREQGRESLLWSSGAVVRCYRRVTAHSRTDTSGIPNAMPRAPSHRTLLLRNMSIDHKHYANVFPPSPQEGRAEAPHCLLAAPHPGAVVCVTVQTFVTGAAIHVSAS